MSENLAINVWTDGCFDIFHYGHANLLRMSKLMGQKLIVGVHSDLDISKNKTNPVMQMGERKYILESIKWVDEVVLNAPYITDPKTLDHHKCEFCVHGSDAVFCSDGTDCYEQVKKNQRYKSCPRTRCIATTDIIQRVQFPHSVSYPTINQSTDYTYWFKLMEKFQKGNYPPSSNDKVIYIAGKFEFLHPFLIHYLKNIKSPTDYLLVGVYNDEDIRANFSRYPLLNTIERSLSMVACKYVNWVAINAPYKISSDFIKRYHIKKIYYGDCDCNKNDRINKYSEIPNNIISRTLPPKELSSEFIFDRIRMKRRINKIDI